MQKISLNIISILALFVSTFTLMGCSDSKELDEPEVPQTGGQWITIADTDTDLRIPFEGETKTISFKLGNGYDAQKLTAEVHETGKAWCSASIKGTELTVTVERSYVQQSRSTMVTIIYDSSHKKTIYVTQAEAPSTEDTKINVVSATPEDGMDDDHLIAKSYDGDKATYFNSPTGPVTYPYIIEYTLEAGHQLDRIVYTPRTDSGNKWGSFNEFTISASTADKPDEFVELKKFARGDANHTPMVYNLATPVKNVAKVRFTITKSYMDRVSVAEMEFWENNPNKLDVSSLFEDAMCTKLRSGLTEMQINQLPDENLRNAALAMLQGNYDTNYRLADFRPYQNPAIRAAENKTNKYSLRDNATGIYAVAGQPLYVAVGKIYSGGDISLLIQDVAGGYNNYKTYPLQEGVNEITPEIDGLIYVINLVNDNVDLQADENDPVVKAKSVKIHFIGGNVQGYFDVRKHTAEDWKNLMANGKYREIDVLGRYAHVTWKLQDFKSANTDILKTVENVDRLVYLEQEFAGLEKYNRMFRNRMHLCIDYAAKSPNASDYRTVYNASNSESGVGSKSSYAEIFTNPSRFAVRVWGPAHEVGHVNQVRPGVKWIGMTEVTNNIYSLYIQTSFGEKCKLQVDKASDSGIDKGFVNKPQYSADLVQSLKNCKNFYEQAKVMFVDYGVAHCLPDIDVTNLHEVQLVPFWQLKLYMIDAQGKKDFYHDLFEHYRKTSNLSDNGQMQLDFVRQCCAASGMNLLEAFEKWGFLTPVNVTINDYSKSSLVITRKMVDDLKAEINAKGYNIPKHKIWEITDETVNNFK